MSRTRFAVYQRPGVAYCGEFVCGDLLCFWCWHNLFHEWDKTGGWQNGGTHDSPIFAVRRLASDRWELVGPDEDPRHLTWDGRDYHRHLQMLPPQIK